MVIKLIGTMITEGRWLDPPANKGTCEVHGKLVALAWRTDEVLWICFWLTC